MKIQHILTRFFGIDGYEKVLEFYSFTVDILRLLKFISDFNQYLLLTGATGLTTERQHKKEKDRNISEE